MVFTLPKSALSTEQKNKNKRFPDSAFRNKAIKNKTRAINRKKAKAKRKILSKNRK